MDPDGVPRVVVVILDPVRERLNGKGAGETVRRRGSARAPARPERRRTGGSHVSEMKLSEDERNEVVGVERGEAGFEDLSLQQRAREGNGGERVVSLNFPFLLLSSARGSSPLAHDENRTDSDCFV